MGNYTQGCFDNKIKGVKADYLSYKGEKIYSGQKVKAHGGFSPPEIYDVEFSPNHGFRINGNNLADAYVLEVVQDISFFEKIKGSLGLLLHNIT